MKALILSGAYKNAGDFLIVDRSIKLIKHCLGQCELMLVRRDECLENRLEEINQYDIVFVAGGPFYMRDIYPNHVPLVKCLADIKPYIVPIGCGWYGAEDSAQYIYNDYTFTEKTQELILRMMSDAGRLSCRDWYSVRILQANGFDKTIMTGCPAWYDLKYVECSKINPNIQKPYKKICISDPAKMQNIDQIIPLVMYLQGRYKTARIQYVFHRGQCGINEKHDKLLNILMEQLKELNVEIYNIEGSKEGFSIYDDCDLHIGYRVHAHIYNLSRRNLSVLIEEDGRGAGVNHALGLERIKAYAYNPYLSKGSTPGKVNRKAQRFILGVGIYKCNEWLLRELDDYLNQIEVNDYHIFERAFLSMQDAFDNMCMYLKQIREKIGE